MSTDVSKLAFDSVFRYERIFSKGSATFGPIAPFGIQTVTIPHNLGYKPYVKAWYSYGGNIYDLFAGPASYNVDGNGGQIDNSYVTTSDFVVVPTNFGFVDISGTIYYRIYAEPQQ